MNITGSSTSSLECDITDKIYICDENACGVKSIQLNIDKTTHTGHLSIKNNDGIQVIDFGMCTNEYGIFLDMTLNMLHQPHGVWKIIFL